MCRQVVTANAGTGEDFDPAKAVPLKAGSYMMHPARAIHGDGAKDENDWRRTTVSRHALYC